MAFAPECQVGKPDLHSCLPREINEGRKTASHQLQEVPMKDKKIFGLVFCSLALVLIASGVHAHNLWLNPGNHYPQVGETVDIEIGWGHKYPKNRTDQEVKEDRVEEITALDPDGKTTALDRVSGSLFKLRIEKEGVYLVTARIKPGVFTTTPEGRKWATKKEVENPVKCMAFHICAKTVIVAGGKDRNLTGVTNQPLELIPLENPGKLKKGSSFPVKVLYERKPLANFPVKAVYAGYEEPAPAAPVEAKPAGNSEGKGKEGESAGGKGSGETAHKGAMVRFPVETTTDEKGQASLKLDREGFWMVTLSQRVPYPDPETCDESMTNATFTFQVK
jgi:uncharacterized GH25 family protein